MLPTPGSRWSHPESGGVFTVADVDLRRGVLLLGDAGQAPVRLAPYAWPGAWTLVPGESQGSDGLTERHRLRTLLLGGAEGQHLLRSRRILDEMGFRLIAHDPGSESRRLSPIGADIEVVVVIRSHFNHSAYQEAKKLTKERGLPMALVDSNGMKEALRLERERLKLGIWVPTDAFGAPPPLPPADGWWTWGGAFWVWTTVESAGRPLGFSEDARAPGVEGGMDTGDALGSVGLVVAGWIALFGR